MAGFSIVDMTKKSPSPDHLIYNSRNAVPRGWMESYGPRMGGELTWLKSVLIGSLAIVIGD